MSGRVQIVDVTPRDGLQIEPKLLPPQKRLELIQRIQAAGVTTIEIGAFVSARRVPQMADLPEICRHLDMTGAVRYTALVPNLKGFTMAAASGMSHVRLAVLASESLNNANFECSIEQSLKDFEAIARQARTHQMAFGVIIGAAFGCPLEGPVPGERVMQIAQRVAGLGADEIVLADTTGMAMPDQVRRVCGRLIEDLARTHAEVAAGIHLHNTRNTGYANAYAAHLAGMRRFDASSGGIGGCPFSPGALGNIATEDLVHLFNGMGVDTGIDLEKLMTASGWLAAELGKELPAMIGRAEPVYHRPRGLGRAENDQ